MSQFLESIPVDAVSHQAINASSAIRPSTKMVTPEKNPVASRYPTAQLA
jgi:hypothetical protein